MSDSRKNTQTAYDKQKNSYQERKKRGGKFRRALSYVVIPLKRIDSLITAISTLLLVLVTAGLVIVAYWQFTDSTLHETLVAANRAWIAPRNAQLTAPIVVGKWLEFQIIYDNVGKEPALHVVDAQPHADIFDLPPTKTRERDWIEKFIPPNYTCGMIDFDVRKGLVVYPTAPSPVIANGLQSYAFADGRGVPQEFFDGKKIFYTQGCFAYQTFKAKRTSAYCFLLLPIAGKPPDQWAFKFCPTGNNAT